jgi:FixJ family two-component response regulator
MTTRFAELLTRASYPETPSPSPTAGIVFVVADHADMRRSLEQLISTTGVDVEHCSAEEFLSLPRPAVPCCLLLDVSLPGTNGLELQRQVGARMYMPIVFTGSPDARVSIQAMKAGAVDVLVEPVTPKQLSSAIDAAIELSRASLLRNAALQQLRDRYASLTSREREVMGLVVSGLLNKQVAFELGITERTVKEHRGNVMRKMQADSLPDLVRMAARLDAAPAPTVKPDSCEGADHPHIDEVLGSQQPRSWLARITPSMSGIIGLASSLVCSW